MNTTASIETLQKALDRINRRWYHGNIAFRYPPKPISSKRHQFTITVNQHRGPGGRLKTKAACWHAHGHLFDAILRINPDAVIKTAGRDVYKRDGQTIGNWQDWNIGSLIEPRMYSEDCHCQIKGNQ